jgi:hypothetical protein
MINEVCFVAESDVEWLETYLSVNQIQSLTERSMGVQAAGLQR